MVASDIVASFIDENKRRHSEFPHVSFIVSDANDLRFPHNSFDLIFANWLLMYLNDEQLDQFAERLYEWLSPNGRLFFRESCESRSLHPTSLSFCSPPLHLLSPRHRSSTVSFESLWVSLTLPPCLASLDSMGSAVPSITAKARTTRHYSPQRVSS